MTDGRMSKLWVAVAAAVVVLAGCGSTPSSSSTTKSTRSTSVTTSTEAPTTTSTHPTTTTSTSGIPAGWTEAELLSQLIMVGGSYSDPSASEQDVQGGAGGLVFLGQPPAGSGPTLTSQMDSLLQVAHIVPLMATDEEGGEIERLSNVVGALPWPRQMAEQWTPAEVTAQVTSVATKMKALGMNTDLAPVLDTASINNTIDDENHRSFSEVGATAGTYGLAFRRALRRAACSEWSSTFPDSGTQTATPTPAPPPIPRCRSSKVTISYPSNRPWRALRRDDEQRHRT